MSYTNNASDIVYNYIITNIKTGKWKSGDKIWSEQVLCKELAVSRIAVRQAIEKLCARSVLRKKQGSGTYVENVNDAASLNFPFFLTELEDMLYFLEFRRFFDTANVALYIERASDKSIALLEENYENMTNSTDDEASFHYYDFEFHQLIAEGTMNPVIIQITNVFRKALEDLQIELFKSVGPTVATEYHRLILKYIKERNAELACIYTRMHLELNIEKVKSQIKTKDK